MSNSDWELLLKNAGLRVTAQRLSILEVISRNPHAQVDSIVARVNERIGKISVQAVYDVLRILAGAGLVRQIEPAGSAVRFEVRVGDNHHHVVCRICGITQDIDCVVGHAPCLEPSSTNGFVLDEAEVTFWGFCPECQNSKIVPKFEAQ